MKEWARDFKEIAIGIYSSIASQPPARKQKALANPEPLFGVLRRRTISFTDHVGTTVDVR